MSVGMKIHNINNLHDDENVLKYFKNKEVLGNTDYIDEYTHSSRSINTNLLHKKNTQ